LTFEQFLGVPMKVYTTNSFVKYLSSVYCIYSLGNSTFEHFFVNPWMESNV
jgi:hypothetical protein